MFSMVCWEPEARKEFSNLIRYLFSSLVALTEVSQNLEKWVEVITDYSNTGFGIFYMEKKEL